MKKDRLPEGRVNCSTPCVQINGVAPQPQKQ